MRNFLRSFAVLGFLALTACGTPLGDFLSTATTTITNPINSTDIYRAKNVYAAALQGIKDYRIYCWSKPYAAILADPIMKPVCQNRRPIVRAMQSAEGNAKAAIASAEAFVRDNPTLNAANAITAMWTAVTNFQNAVPAVKSGA